ncbi:MAG: (Fe-S)-binding protein [Deltaproteobacteria bacterium]|nr:(Fe-S)-binding protein [Deltaproteobacteria bacterium]MBZ0218832.1 (Fe-S)-binding protein [Deltaproteobacteria bacterium]
MKPLNLLKHEIDKCVRCGTCRSTCPTTKVLGVETASPRGRISLVSAYSKGEIGLSETYLKHLKECTLCGACRTNCPNNVDTVSIFAAARAEAVEKQGVPLTASLAFRGLKDSGGIVGMGLKLASRLQGLLFKDASAGSGLVSRFSLPLVGNGRLVPPLAKTFFLDLPEVKALSGAGEGNKPRVAFYAGCGINYLMPWVGTKSIELIKRAGAGVEVPGGQSCCGMPAYAMGDLAAAREMARKNLEALESSNADFIATSCATCGHGLKAVMPELLSGDPALKLRAEKVSSRVRDISELLLNELKFKTEGSGNGPRTVVTYHDPCHLGRAQGLREEPRELLKMGSGVKLKEMKNPCLCCGLGGGLMYANYELSMEIAAKKAENIKKSGADVVATACPGCIVQLKDGLHRAGIQTEAKHVVELL